MIASLARETLARPASLRGFHERIHLGNVNRMNGNSPTTGVEPCASWRDLYMTALFETDRAKVPSRIQEAEKALVARARELFLLPGEVRERQAVNTALNALNALRDCVEAAGTYRRAA
jgi:hypothetical protein